MQARAIKSSNPYLTAFIGDSYAAGKQFQVGAKISSSVETIWGSWIERVIYAFNSSIFPVGAGGFDCVLGEVAYDIKSGPAVMNKGMVEEAKAKREVILGLQSTDLKDMVRVRDFKVAITYGKKSTAGQFMKSLDWILFGAETWRGLTGDEWNAYRVFLWQLRYVMTRQGSAWDEGNSRRRCHIS